MQMPIEILETAVLALPQNERSHLLELLIASLDNEPDIQSVWALEAARRDDEINNGSADMLDGEESVRRLRAQLK